MAQEDTIRYESKEIPRGSRLEKYLKEFPEVIGKKQEARSFLNKVFHECLDFVWQCAHIPYRPRITVYFVLTHDQFQREEDRESKVSTPKEVAKKPELTSFCGWQQVFQKDIC